MNGFLLFYLITLAVSIILGIAEKFIDVKVIPGRHIYVKNIIHIVLLSAIPFFNLIMILWYLTGLLADAVISIKYAYRSAEKGLLKWFRDFNNKVRDFSNKELL